MRDRTFAEGLCYLLHVGLRGAVVFIAFFGILKVVVMGDGATYPAGASPRAFFIAAAVFAVVDWLVALTETCLRRSKDGDRE